MVQSLQRSYDHEMKQDQKIVSFTLQHTKVSTIWITKSFNTELSIEKEYEITVLITVTTQGSFPSQGPSENNSFDTGHSNYEVNQINHSH